MAQGDVFIDGDGKIGIDATGKIRLVDASSDCPDCCGCTDDGADCTHCDDVDPSQYEVTFDSVETCLPQCEVTAEWLWASGYSDATINTAHTLTQKAGSNCTWEKVISGAIRYNDTSSNGCGGTGSTDVSTGTLTIQLVRSSTTWTLRVFSSYLSLNGIFSDTQNEVSTGECATVPSFTNDQTQCYDGLGGGETPPFNFDQGFNGSATVACL